MVCEADNTTAIYHIDGVHQLGERKTPNKNKVIKNTLTKHKVRDPDMFDYRTLTTFRKCLEREGITLTFSM